MGPLRIKRPRRTYRELIQAMLGIGMVVRIPDWKDVRGGVGRFELVEITGRLPNNSMTELPGDCG